jgi:Na+-driven multidrug efflux pump
VFSSIMRASGTVLAPTAIYIIAVLAIEVPAAWLLSQWIGMDGVWIAYPVAFAAMLVMQATFYIAVWRKRTITALI